MRSFLIIFESKVKAEQIKNLLKDNGYSNFNSIATGGRLYDLNTDFISIDNDLSMEEVPINPNVIQKIKNESAKYSDLYIATDLDSEGEKIALDILRTTGKKSYKRIDPERINERNVDLSLSNVFKLDENEVRAQAAKRIFDRFVGYQTESRIKEQIGRVLSPTLNAVDAGGFTTSVFEKELSDGKRLILKSSQTSMLENDSIAEALDSINSVSAVLESSKETSENLSFWTGEQAMINISIALDMPVRDVFDSLQRLHEGGLISYFRTDSCKITSSDASMLRDIAIEWGVDSDDLGEIVKKSEAKDLTLSRSRVVHGGHGALIPKKVSINPFLKMNQISKDEQVLSILTRHSLRCMKKPGIIKENKYSLSTTNNKKLHSLISKYNLKVDLIERTLTPSGESSKRDYYPEIYIEGVNIRHKKESGRSVKSFSLTKDIAVGMVMYRIGVGRPSTFAYHADKISEKMMSDNCSLNGIGLLNLDFAKTNYKKLLESETYNKLEDAFYSSGLSVKDRVSNALHIAGILTDESSDGLNASNDIDSEIERIIESENEFVERERAEARIKEREDMKRMLMKAERDRAKDKESIRSSKSNHNDLDM